MGKTKTFYLHIQSDTLAHYLVRGVFCPSRFLSNKNRDIQDQYNSFLLLSDKQWNADSDCSIEVTLIEGDIAKLMQLQDHYFVYADCLPISRLIKIHFADKEKAENVIWNINQGAAFVPEWAISYQYKSKPETVKLEGQHNFPETYSEQKLKTKMEAYDRLMGGLAFMKIGLLNSSFRDLDTTTNYLSAVTYFNSQITNEVKSEKIAVNTNFQNIFSGNNPIFKYLAKPISIDDVNESGKKEKQKVQKQFNAIKLESIDTKSLTYKLAILHTYGKGKVKSDNDLVFGLLSNTTSNLVEELALVFGLHTGYTALRNSYTSNNRKVEVKYKLNTKLEFYLIESLFNYAFKDHKTSDKIEFLENISPRKQEIKSNKSFNYISLLGDSYAYEKQAKVVLEKDSLTSMLLNTIKNWCQKNSAKFDEERLLIKLGKSIIPEIRTTITTNTNDVKIEAPVLPTSNTDSGSKMEKELLLKKETIKSESKTSRNKANTVNEPTLFTDLQSAEIEQNTDNVNDFTFAKLEKYSTLELKGICKEKGYKGYSKFNKEDLIKFILSQ
ncbi:hypothetical protein [Nonlabens antarcticus]|uniref:hypothetical protein n=1 Tax=Nonlabens antarcticus TaxID=392714 RepID=UPI001891AD1A|nr:hypothetical protein [Nonlabens antarcticus]